MKPTFVLLISFAMAAAIGCGGSSEERRVEKEDDSGTMHRFESSFNPADYDPEIPARRPAHQPTEPGGDETRPATPGTESGLVSGFRVQVTFTDNMEQANQIKGQLSPMFEGETVYVVYEAPYYKVRVGDFLTRPEANLTLRSLFEKGYKDSWIVPDKVRKQPE